MHSVDDISVFRVFERDQKTAIKKLAEFYDVLQKLRYEGKMHLGKNSQTAGKLLRYFHEDILGHIRQEEKALFPFLRTHIPKLEPLVCLLLSEHDDCRETLKGLARSHARLEKNLSVRTGALHELYEQGIYFICLMRSHFWVESRNLYQVADRELHVAEKKRLVACVSRKRP